MQRYIKDSGERQDPTFTSGQISGGSPSGPTSAEDLDPASSCPESGGNRVWSEAEDAELVAWATEFPADWQVGGKGSAYLFGSGKYGQQATQGNYNRVLS